MGKTCSAGAPHVREMLKIPKRRRAPSTGARRSPSQGSGQSTRRASSMGIESIEYSSGNVPRPPRPPSRPPRPPGERPVEGRGRRGLELRRGFWQIARGGAENGGARTSAAAATTTHGSTHVVCCPVTFSVRPEMRLLIRCRCLATKSSSDAQPSTCREKCISKFLQPARARRETSRS